MNDVWTGMLTSLLIGGFVFAAVWCARYLWLQWGGYRSDRRWHAGGTAAEFEQMIQEENLQLRGQVDYYRIRYSIMESCVVKLAAETLGEHYEFSSFSRVLEQYLELNFAEILNVQDQELLRKRIMSYIRAENRLDKD